MRYLDMVNVLMRISTICLATACVAWPLFSADAVSPKDQLEILSGVLGAEIQANGWSKGDAVCFSFDGRNPDASLVKALRQRHLNISKENFSCDFQIYVGYKKVDVSHVTVHSYILDLRDVRKGESDLATLKRDGEYLLTQTAGVWSIQKYVSKKLTPSR